MIEYISPFAMFVDLSWRCFVSALMLCFFVFYISHFKRFTEKW